MPRPPLPGSCWIHARIKVTTDEMDAFKTLATRERMTDAALVTAAVRTAISRVTPEALRAYRALRGIERANHKAKAPPPPPKAKRRR